MVEVEPGLFINTIKLGDGPPLLIVHGFAGGLGMFVQNMESLAQYYTVYCIDLIGFGRSSRPNFSGTTPEEAENFFIEPLEKWIFAMDLDNIILMGHSLGAFLVAILALKNPKRISRLILVDPFGMSQKPKSFKLNIGFKILTSVNLISPSPLSILRGLGPLGPVVFKKLRQDLVYKFSSNTEGSETMIIYTILMQILNHQVKLHLQNFLMDLVDH